MCSISIKEKDGTYFAVVVDDLNPFAFSRNDPSADGDIKLSFGTRLDPNVVALESKGRKKKNSVEIIEMHSLC